MLDFIDIQIFLMVKLYFKIISKDIHKGAQKSTSSNFLKIQYLRIIWKIHVIKYK